MTVIVLALLPVDAANVVGAAVTLVCSALTASGTVKAVNVMGEATPVARTSWMLSVGVVTVHSVQLVVAIPLAFVVELEGFTDPAPSNTAQLINTPADSNGFSVEGVNKATAGDVAIVKDRAYFAVLKQGAVALFVYANATTTATPLRQVSFAREPRISAITNVRDGRVAVAATETRVAVVWTTAKFLQNNDTTGGYAVFACTP